VIGRSAILAGFILLVVFTGAAQSNSEKITEKDKREVNRVAHRFSDRLIQQKDLGLLLTEFFAPNFIERSLSNKSRAWTLLIKREFAGSRKPRELRRYFIAENNWLFLFMLHHYSRFTVNEDAPPISQTIPADIKVIAEKFDPRFAETLRYDEADDDSDDDFDANEARINSPEGFPKYLRMLESLGSAMKRHANKAKAGKTRVWRESVSYLAKQYDYFEPWMSKCSEEDCFGMPRGSNIYRVNIPLLQLFLIKLNGKMKVVFAYYYID
jgi:hypothetical protein